MSGATSNAAPARTMAERVRIVEFIDVPRMRNLMCH
jgi:hypothetical protein